MTINLMMLIELFTITAKVYLSLYLVFTLLKSPMNALRLLVSSFIAGAYTIGKIVIQNDGTLLSLIISTIAVLIAKKDYTFSEFMKVIFLYFIVEILSKAIEITLVSEVAPNENLSKLMVCFSILLTSFLLKITLFLLSSNTKRKCVYKVILQNGERAFKTRAYWDSGNLLYLKGVPVILITNRIASRLQLRGNKNVNVTTVNGTSSLRGGEVVIRIFSDKKTHKIHRVCYAISDTIVSRGYEVILHKDMEII